MVLQTYGHFELPPIVLASELLLFNGMIVLPYQLPITGVTVSLFTHTIQFTSFCVMFS
jgi:hypothetical protein